MPTRLLAGADVLLTNLLAPRLERFQLTPGVIRERHPRLVFCSVTGYGLSGPDAARPRFDFAAFWARAGIMSVVGHPGGQPVLSRVAQGDHTTGMNALATNPRRGARLRHPRRDLRRHARSLRRVPRTNGHLRVTRLRS